MKRQAHGADAASSAHTNTSDPLAAWMSATSSEKTQRPLPRRRRPETEARLLWRNEHGDPQPGLPWPARAFSLNRPSLRYLTAGADNTIHLQYNFIAKLRVNTLITRGMFCVARYTHHTFTPIIKHLITTTANKHPGKMSFTDKNMRKSPLASSCAYRLGETTLDKAGEDIIIIGNTPQPQLQASWVARVWDFPRDC